MKKISLAVAVVLVLPIFNACKKDGGIILPGSDPNFTIEAHNDPGFRATNRKVDVLEFPSMLIRMSKTINCFMRLM